MDQLAQQLRQMNLNQGEGNEMIQHCSFLQEMEIVQGPFCRVGVTLQSSDVTRKPLQGSVRVASSSWYGLGDVGGHVQDGSLFDAAGYASAAACELKNCRIPIGQWDWRGVGIVAVGDECLDAMKIGG